MTIGFDILEGRPMQDGSEGNPGKPSEFMPAGAAGDDPLTRNLKKVYEEVAAEPIPEEWLKLLDQLDAKAKGRPDD